MREFRIKVNNEKTYVVKANDYNQAVKTLHSKLRDFDDTKKNINVVREFITNNGGKFSKSKDADAILDFIYKKTGVKNADYGDVLYIVRNYTNVKVEDSAVTDFDLTNFLALKRSLELRIGEEIDFDKLEEYVNKLPKDKNGKKNVDVKEVIKCCVKAKDNAVSDSVSKYNGEDAIKTNGFVKIKEDGDWTSYKYNGSDFDDAVFKIHQYNPSLIAFISNGNRTITVRNKYLNDADDTAQGEIEVLKSFGFDYKDGRWVKESNNNTIIIQPDYHYVSVIGPGDTEKHCKKYQYQSAGMLKKIIASNIKDSDIKDSDSYQVWTINEKGVYHKEAEVSDPQSAKAIASQLKKQGRWAQISKNSKTNIVSDSDITDADPVKVEKIIRKEKSALGITYYLFQTKSNSGATIYFEVTDKTYHGEPTYSGGGVISFSLQSANDSLDSHLLYDKLVSKYGKEAGRKRFLLGKNDSAICDMAETDMSMLQNAKRVPAHNIYYNRVSYDDLKRTINKVMEEGNDKDVVNILIGQLSELRKDYEADIKNSKLDKEETKRHYGEYKRLVNNYKNSHISKEYTNAVNSFLSAIKDSNIKDAGEEIRYLEGMKFNGVPYTGWAVQHWTDGYYTFDGKKPYIPSGGRDALLSIFKQGGFIGQWKGIKPDKGFESYFRHSTAVPAVRDSNNIKNRKSYTIKVGDKQYKVFAESESEAINKYIKSKKQ